MRLHLAGLAVLVLLPSSLLAQNYWVGDTLSPQIRVRDCAMADSLLGFPAAGVMKAEVHGALESPTSFRLKSGPVSYHNRLPAMLDLFPLGAPPGHVPGGIFMMWFYSSILRAPRDSTKPFTLIVDDSLHFVLGMPEPPRIEGPVLEATFYNAIITPEAVAALNHGKKARVEFLGKKQDIEGKRLVEFAGVTRLAICARAGQL